ncbi:lactadherin-like [Acanthaster planci]|uniref:Lactadherin-like n=1 Tax=Acanthaster planci TaxID=133434 RepID=A0A8B7XTA2_ACAPL|nr:lactadherin-like [Acanthaster planci]
MDVSCFGITVLFFFIASSSMTEAGLSVGCCNFRKMPDSNYLDEERWFPQSNDPPCDCQHLRLLKRLAKDSSYEEDFYKPPWKTTHKEAVCQDPLGMESGAIPDDNLSVSHVGHTGFGREKSRLNTKGAWCPEPIDTNQWITVDLGNKITVSGLITQGRHHSDVWTKSYRVQYSADGTNWNYITASGSPKEFQGNSDNDSHVTVIFPEPLQTRYVKIEPRSWQRYICIRFELLGCRA